MMNFTIMIGFIGLVVPLFTIMMGIVIYTDIKSKEVLAGTEDSIQERA